MTAFNIVKFRVKPGHQEQFIAKHRGINPGLKGFRGGALVRTGENTILPRRMDELPEDRRRAAPNDRHSRWFSRASRRSRRRARAHRSGIRRGSTQTFSHQVDQESAWQKDDQTQKAPLIPRAVLETSAWRGPRPHTPGRRPSATVFESAGRSAAFHRTICLICGSRTAPGSSTAVSPMARGRDRSPMSIGRATRPRRPSSCSSMAVAGNAAHATSTPLSALRWRRKASSRLCRINRSFRRRVFRCLSRT
jgi:hypothetical protein